MNLKTLFLPLLLSQVVEATELEPPPAALEAVVVVATRSPRPVDEVAGVVTLIDRSAISQPHVSGLRGLTRYQVGLSAEAAAGRFGETGLNVRGIGGNRVALELDGIPLSEQFDVGSYANAGRTFVDPELIQRVEVLRGPASSLYGSDAIGGVAAYFTPAPQDLVAANGFGQRWRSSFDSADASWQTSLLSGWNSDRTGLVAGLVYRRGNELNHAVRSPVEDPLSFSNKALLLKAETILAPGHELSAIAMASRADRNSDIQTILGSGRFRSTTELLGDDEQERDGLTLSYDFATPLRGIHNGSVKLFHQDSRTRQVTHEERASRDARYLRSFDFDQTTDGLRVALYRQADGWNASHRLGFGLDISRSEVVEQRAGIQTRLDGSEPTSTILGETFPVRDFPVSETSKRGFWVQDEIDWQRLTLIAGLRHDSVKLTPKPDAIYQSDNPVTEVVAIDQSRTTARLGALFKMFEQWTAFAQLAEGFRAPPFNDANIGLDIPRFNIRAIPNPQLKSETSRSVELGLRGRSEHHRLELAVFSNRYSDFIESKVNLGPDPASGVILFQSQNVDRARIRGLELRYAWLPGGADSAWKLRAEAFVVDGKNLQTGAPLVSVGPDEALLGVDWASSVWPVQAALHWRLFDAVDTQAGGAEQFQPPGAGIVDAQINWQLTAATALAIGAYNLTNQAAWNWHGVRGLGTDDPSLAQLSQPGRSLAATVSFNF